MYTNKMMFMMWAGGWLCGQLFVTDGISIFYSY
jgi:hypothetical protein